MLIASLLSVVRADSHALIKSKPSGVYWYNWPVVSSSVFNAESNIYIVLNVRVYSQVLMTMYITQYMCVYMCVCGSGDRVNYRTPSQLGFICRSNACSCKRTEKHLAVNEKLADCGCAAERSVF